MKHDEYHRQFAEGIIEQIRQGTALWQKPWGPGERVLPANVDTGRSYRGGNSLHLAAVQQERGYGDVRWGTYRQIQARDGQVQQGRAGHSHPLVPGQEEDRRQRRARTAQVRDNEGNRVYRHERLPRRPSSASTPCSTPSRPTGCRPGPAPTAEPLWKVHQQAEQRPRGQRGARPSRGGGPRVLQPEQR